ncbi:hypothetical protein DFH06DRAFT_1240037 [Mycena polygramma]|nr:hypothetical protein DFH06DRAFT_1240037 [Mycena polygramma]
MRLLLAVAVALPLVSAQSVCSASCPRFSSAYSFLRALVNPAHPPQSGSSGASASAQITVITSVSTSVGLGSGRVPTTAVSTILITSTIQPTPASSADPNSSPASSAASSTTTANLPTGTVSLVTDQAPSPGATGGAYGPDDGFINSARSLQRNALLLTGLSAIVGALVV